jgi:colanic acid/amylovoran biosynthesis glycosyltransferase
LRVAFFVYEFPALSETFVLSQITGLIDLGHDVTIFAVRARQDPLVHPDVVRYSLRERTRYLQMPRRWAPRVTVAAALFLRYARCRIGTMLRCLDVWHYGRDAASLRLFYWAVRMFGEASFDVIHCHFGPIGKFVAKLRDTGAIAGRLVTVFHGVDVSAYVRGRPDYYRSLFAAGDLFLPISRLWQRKLVELGCDPARLAVHHMGVDVHRYPFQIRRYDPRRSLRLLTVGRMIEKKGIEYGLRAVAEVTRRGVSVRYVLVGDGPLRPGLEIFARRLGIASCVRFLGWQDQMAVSALMETSDVLLAPSVTTADGDQEGIPVTLMEAMAAGMLVIATDHSGIPELVEHDRSGLLVPERDVSALAEALLRLLRTSELWPRMSHAARARILDEFEVTKLNEDLVRRYRTLLGAPGVPWPTKNKPPGAPAQRAFVPSRVAR